MAEPPSPITLILRAASEGASHAADQLLPLVYDELRKVAHAKMANEAPGITLQPTALVHEAYLRVMDKDAGESGWDSRRHFFGRRGGFVARASSPATTRTLRLPMMAWQRSRSLARAETLEMSNEGKTFHQENVREVPHHQAARSRLGDL